MQFYLIKVVSELAAGQWFSLLTGFHTSIFATKLILLIVVLDINTSIVKVTVEKLTQQVVGISLHIRIIHAYFRIFYYCW